MLDPEDEDTIEMELTPSQIAGLEEAAEQAEREAAAARALVRARQLALMPATALAQAPPSAVMPATAVVQAPPQALMPATARVQARQSAVMPATALVEARPPALMPATTFVEVRPQALMPVTTLVHVRPAAAVAATAFAVAATVVDSLPAVIPRPALAATPAPKGRRYLVIVGAAIVVAVSVATAYQLGTRSQTSSPPAEAAPRVIIEHPPASEAKLPEVPLPPPKAIPVRFANPFDTSEVFEFPPGTSEAEARNAVADVLLKRARQRQMQRPEDPSLARRS